MFLVIFIVFVTMETHLIQQFCELKTNYVSFFFLLVIIHHLLIEAKPVKEANYTSTLCSYKNSVRNVLLLTLINLYRYSMTEVSIYVVWCTLLPLSSKQVTSALIETACLQTLQFNVQNNNLVLTCKIIFLPRIR